MMRLVFGALVAMLVLAGCSKPSLVGQWTITGIGGSAGPMTAKFEEDGRFEATGSYLNVELKVTGSYALEEGVVTLRPVNLDARDPSGKIPLELIETGKSLLSGQVLRERTGGLTWKDKDTAEMKDAGGEMITLKRIKPGA